MSIYNVVTPEMQILNMLIYKALFLFSATDIGEAAGRGIAHRSGKV